MGGVGRGGVNSKTKKSQNIFSSEKDFPGIQAVKILSLGLDRFLILNSGSSSDCFDGAVTHSAGF